jgi:protein phosphatase
MSLDHHCSEGGTVSPRISIETAGRTDIGLRRELNEDAFTVRSDLGLFVVADGLGGHAAGDVASALAVEAIAAFLETPDMTWPGDADGAVSDPCALLVASIKHANNVIHRAAAANRTKRGMGTTVVAALTRESRVWFAHVGDSRLYLFRDGHLVQLTQDHTVANAWIAEGMEVDLATKLPVGRELLRAVGTRPAVDVDARVEEMRPGDVLLLTSDGVHGPVKDRELAEILGKLGDLVGGVDQIIARANAEGGKDNSTAVLVRWTQA